MATSCCPCNLGLQERADPVTGQTGTVLHTPPLIPQDYRRFQYTGVVPSPWLQLNLTYGNSTLAGTVILASTAATEAEAFYDPVRQLGVSNAYVTLNLSKQVGTLFQIRGGAMQERYGSMGAFDSGRYATPLIARINSVGETATAGFKTGVATVVLEQGIGSQLGRMPTGMPSEGWNDFGDPNVGASYVGHFHGGLSLAGLASVRPALRHGLEPGRPELGRHSRQRPHQRAGCGCKTDGGAVWAFLCRPCADQGDQRGRRLGHHRGPERPRWRGARGGVLRAE